MITSTPDSTAELLERSQRLPGPPAEASEFFSDAHNLEAITPPWLHFRVLTEAPIAMGFDHRAAEIERISGAAGLRSRRPG